MKFIQSRFWWIILIAFLLIFPLVSSSLSFLNNATEILIDALFGVSLNLLIGYTGLLSLGHCAFFALGSYGTGILLREASISIPLALVGGAFLAADLADPAGGRFGVLGGAWHYWLLQLSLRVRTGFREFLHAQNPAGICHHPAL